MIIATGTGLELLEVLGLIAGIVTGVCLLAAFIIKALIHKTIFPIKEEQNKHGSDMKLMEQRITALEDDKKEILRKLDDLHNTIIQSLRDTLRQREELYDSKYVHQKKQ